MEKILSRFSLKYQIACIGLIGVLGLAGFAAEYLISDAEQSRIQARADRQAAAQDLLTAVQIDLLLARRAEKDFLLRRAETYIERHAKIVQGVFAKFDALAALVAGSDLSARLATTATASRPTAISSPRSAPPTRHLASTRPAACTAPCVNPSKPRRTFSRNTMHRRSP